MIIPTYQRPHLLDEALRSVANQVHNDVEVVVVNDGGSTVAATVDRWRPLVPIALVESETRRGPAAARNTAIEHARGEHLAFLDDDDVFLPDHLAAAHRVLTAEPDLDFVYLGAVVSSRRVDALPSDRSAMPTKAYPFDRRFLLVANFIHTGSVVVKNFHDSGLRFDPSLEVCEDWDLWLALTFRLGCAGRLVDGLTTVYHQVPGSSGLVQDAQRRNPSPFARTRARLYERWPAGDDQVCSYRRWCTRFEACRNEAISAGRPIHPHLFDQVLDRLHEAFRRGEEMDTRLIRDLVGSGDQAPRDVPVGR